MRNPALVLIPILGALCLWPAVPSPLALLMGVAVALIFGNPYSEQLKKITPRLMALSIVGLGFGMNLIVLAKVGYQGIVYTIIGIAVTFAFGWLLGRAFKVSRDISLLVSAGTAICGASAITAISAVIRAKSHDITVALGTVFLWNAVALMVFPLVGHSLGLSDTQFGLWAGLAIHDTSSVVGAALQFSPGAVESATTVKLARALWIIPLALLIGFVRSRDKHVEVPAGGFKKPWFILGFVMAAALMTWVPSLQPAGHVIESVARRTMVLTLFLIGVGLTRATLRAVGFKPFMQGFFLWCLVSSLTLAAIVAGWIA